MTDTLVPIANSTRLNPHETPTAAPAAGDFASDFWGADGFTFGDILDLINPLQHLPVISTLYREMTGDDISSGARILGSGLFGGLTGFFAAVFNTALEEATGNDLGGHVMALFDGEPVASPVSEPAPAVTAQRRLGKRQDAWMIAEAAGTTRQATWQQTASLGIESRRDRGATSIVAWRREEQPAEPEIAVAASDQPMALPVSEPAPAVTAQRRPGRRQDAWMIAEAAGTTRQATWQQTASLGTESRRDRGATSIAAWRREEQPAEPEIAVAASDQPMALPVSEPAPAVTAQRRPGRRQDAWMIAEAAGTTRQATWQQTASLGTESRRDRGATSIAAWRREEQPAEPEIAVAATVKPTLAALAVPALAGDEISDTPLWLTGIPHVKGDYTAFTTESMATATADLLFKAIGHAPDGDARLREAVDRYEQGAAVEYTRDIVVDKLF